MRVRKTKGTLTPSGKRQIAVTLDPELLEALVREAVASERPVSALIRYYIKLGMKQNEQA
jgi:hypothetical protein